MPNQTMDINATQCLVSKSHWGYDTIMNICSGKNINVDWVMGDYIAASFLLMMVIMVTLMLVYMLKCIIFDN